MASCGGGGCQSQCHHRAEEEETELPPAVAEPVNRIRGRLRNTTIPGLCSKCGEGTTVYNQQCLDCFRSSLFGKFKVAVTSNAMVSPLDKVLVAFSGGPASRTVLQFIHEMQMKSQKNWDASKDQSLPVFGVGVALIDESAVSHVSSDEVGKAIEVIKQIVTSLTPPYKEMFVMPIENVCHLDSLDGKNRLHNLLDTVSDETGRDDLLQYLRMLSLQKIASENGFTKLMLGTCTTGLASHILSATVKGQGYALPADVQYVDARWEIPIVLPLRDCLSQELKMLCDLDGLKTQQFLDRPNCGINKLISAFLSRLQEENPSRARTVVRTAEKLNPFYFNKLDNVCNDLLPSRMRRKFQSNRGPESSFVEVLCPVCGHPLSDLDSQSLKGSLIPPQEDEALFAAHCCESCKYQILPHNENSLKNFYSFLPQFMIRRVKDNEYSDRNSLREQIKEFLISEDVDS